MLKYFSKFTVGACSALFLLGIITGNSLNNRSLPALQHINGTNAIAIHVSLAILFGVTICSSIVYNLLAKRKRPYSLWVAPFTKNAFQRFKQTVLLGNGISVPAILRALFAVLITALSLYYFFRAGVQILAAGDPNFVINAWGGPSRTGASLAHWLDAIILFYVQAGLLHLILISPKRTTK